MKELKRIKSSLNNIEKTFLDIAYLRNILLEVTARCNLNCVQCANSSMLRKKGDMDFSLFTKIVDEAAEDFPNANIWLSNYGEPLVIGHKIYDMILYVKQKGLAAYMNTNGVLIDEDMADLLVDAGLNHITIGVEGYSAEVYESIRVGAKRDEVYNNVLTLRDKINAKVAREGTSYDPMRMEVQFIVMDENEHELEQYRKYWSEQGVTVNIRGRMTWAGNIPIGSNIDKQMERVACGYTFSAFNILWDGRAVTCANDVNAEYILGDLNTETLTEVWNRKCRDFIDLHFAHRFDKLPEYCRNCYDWQAIGTVGYDEQGKNYPKVYK